MQWFISHQSALEYWRHALAPYALAKTKLRIKKLPDTTRGTKELWAADSLSLSKPLHILVGSDNARKTTRTLRCHISTGVFPSGSFLRATPNLVVSSPELCFMQMASELPFVALIALGYELCGGYRLDRDTETEQGFRNDIALSSVAKLKTYAENTPKLKGRKTALRALQHITDGSASPMETILCMLLTLPYRLGGYGFPLPQLNHCVTVSASLGTNARAAQKAKLYCDLFWPSHRVDIEYDSDAYHTGSDRIAKDAIRRNALSSAGITVLTVSRLQIVRTDELYKVAEILCRLLDRRLKCPMPEFATHHEALHKQLLATISSLTNCT